MVVLTPDKPLTEKLLSNDVQSVRIYVSGWSKTQQKTIAEWFRNQEALESVILKLGNESPMSANDYSFVEQIANALEKNMHRLEQRETFLDVHHKADLEKAYFLFHNYPALVGIHAYCGNFKLESMIRPFDLKTFEEARDLYDASSWAIEKPKSEDLPLPFQQLCVWVQRLDRDTMQNLSKLLLGNTSAAYLALQFDEVGVGGIQALADFIQRDSMIEILHLETDAEPLWDGRPRIEATGEEGMALVSVLKSKPSLKELHLNLPLSQLGGGRVLKQLFINNQFLRTVYILPETSCWAMSGPKTDSVLTDIAEGLLQNNHLVNFGLYMTDEWPSDSEDVALLTRLPLVTTASAIEKLNIQTCSPDTCRHIAAMVRHPFCTLKTLMLQINDFDFQENAAPLVVDALRENTSLEHVVIHSFSASYSGLVALQSILPEMSSLRRLSLHFGSAFAYDHEQAKSQLTQLKSDFVASMKANRSLEELTVYPLCADDKMFANDLQQICKRNKAQRHVRKAAPIFHDAVVPVAALPHFMSAIQSSAIPSGLAASCNTDAIYECLRYFAHNHINRN